MISIIVPVYNSQKHLQRCVDSILSQDFKDYELLLIDDGSTDASSVICDDYASVNSNVRVVHQTNAGASAARNKGIKESQGEYITFIDSDDYISKSYLSDFDVLHAYDFQIQGFTLTYADNRDETVVKPQTTTELSVKAIIEDSELNGLIRGPVCKLFKRSILKEQKIRFPEDISYGEDAIFVKEYLLHCTKSCLAISKSNYIYTHETSSSLTSKFQYGPQFYKATLEEYQLFIGILRKYPNLSNEVLNHFKWLKALDTYQSVYNTLIDNRCSYNLKVSFIETIDDDLLRFIKDAGNLPIKFKLLRFCLFYIPTKIFVYFLSILFK